LALRLVFMGTPDFAVPTLVALAGGGHEIAAVYTRAPQPAGRRGLELTPSPVAREAERLKIPVFTPKTLKDDDSAGAMRSHGADAAVIVAYGLILPKPILDVFPRGCFNLHASLLPRWRGAAPIHRAVMAGDKKTGVKLMEMDEGLDTGLVAKGKRIPIGSDTTTGDLHDELAKLGSDLVVRALAVLKEKRAWKFKPQAKKGVIYANKIDKEESRIDWRKPWNEVHNHCRGLSPFPSAWCEFPAVGRVKILRTTKGEGEGQPGRVLDDSLTIACGSGAIRLVELQRAGGRPMQADEFLRGTPIAPASVLA
jgi:methionyl-tRNA formyltransferase